MNAIQEKMEVFLAGSPKIPEDIIFRASQMFNSKLTKFNWSGRKRGGLPSLSQVGKPFCQLHAEKLGWERIQESDTFKVKMLYGDMTEVIAVAMLLAAGIEIVELNMRVQMPISDNEKLSGELDLIIKDGNTYSVWDIKSASKFAFEKKFVSYDALKNNDDFGYLPQLFGYTEAVAETYPGVKAGGWIAINKESGELKFVLADPDDQAEYVDNIKNTVTKLTDATEDNFVRGFEDVEEIFYKKPTGNRKLAVNCSYCGYRYKCWPGLRYERNPKSRSANAYNFYTVFQEED